MKSQSPWRRLTKCFVLIKFFFSIEPSGPPASPPSHEPPDSETDDSFSENSECGDDIRTVLCNSGREGNDTDPRTKVLSVLELEALFLHSSPNLNRALGLNVLGLINLTGSSQNLRMRMGMYLQNSSLDW